MLNLNINLPKQTQFTVKTDCGILSNSLRLKYGIYVNENGTDGDNVILAVKGDKEYRVRFKDELLYTEYPLKVIDDIMYERREYDDGIYAIHGGAVEYDGGAYIFAAATTSGKTTLTSYLTSKGFGYVTDDCILLDRQSFTVYPFTTPVHLREGGYNVLKRLGCTPTDTKLLDDVSMMRYVYTPESSVSTPLPLKKIFFITRTENENRVDFMSTTERMTELMKSPIREYRLDGEYLEFISRLAKVPCERVYYADMEFVAEVIRHGK